jgi:hypothetical protein
MPVKPSALVAAYLTDTQSIVNSSIAKSKLSAQFAHLFKSALAADSVLMGLNSPRLRPTLATARSVALRLPLLVAVGQRSVATVELRRFLEIIFWCVYFSDHPVEWQEFSTSRKGFESNRRLPISFNAHRELSFYMHYGAELMKREPSKLGSKAIAKLFSLKALLNEAVHAGELARGGKRLIPYEDIKASEVEEFTTLAKGVFANSVVVLAAYNRPRFDRLLATQRAYFDWIVGPTVRKEVTSGPFGL